MLKEEQAKLQSQLSSMEQEKTLSAKKIAELEAQVKSADETVSRRICCKTIQLTYMARL